jgi:hypothetical protein
MLSHVQLGAAGTGSARTVVKLPLRLTQSGLHRFGVQLQNAQDAMEWDDHRELVLDVAEQIRVLVVGAEDASTDGQPRSRSAAFYFQAALAPFGDRAGAPPWSIKPTYRGISQIRSADDLASCSAVFLCDVPRIPVQVADELARYAHAGGRIVWVLGPSIDAVSYNDVLLGQNRDLLPSPLAQPLVAAAAAPVDWIDLHSGLFANLFDSQEPFRALLVTGHWSLAGGDTLTRGRALAKLDDNSPLVIEHTPAGTGTATAGTGKVYTMLTTPAAAWSNLGATVLLVPLASRMAIGAGADVVDAQGSPTSYDAGQDVWIRIPGLSNVSSLGALNGLTIDVTTPSNAVINTHPQIAEGMPRWHFDQTLEAGVYRWKSSDGKHEGLFVVNPPGDEADLLSADLEGLARESTPADNAAKPTIVAFSAPELLTQLERRSEGTSLVPGFVAMVVVLALLESLLASRYRPAAQPLPA